MDLTKCTLVELRQLAKEQEIKNIIKILKTNNSLTAMIFLEKNF